MDPREKPHSLEQADTMVLEWVRTAVPDAQIFFGPPGAQADQAEISLYLMALADAPPLRGPGRVPLQIQAQYLVTVAGSDQSTAHQQLNALIFAALRHPMFEVTFTALSPQFWSAFHVIPQPAFVLAIPIVVEQPLPDIPIVREPPTIDGVPMTVLRGVLLGPGGIPLANATVEYPSLQRKVQTDARGEFTLRAIPREPQAKALRVKAKGKIFDITVAQPAQPEESVIVQVPLFD